MIRFIALLIFFITNSINLFAQTDKIMTYSTVHIPITGMQFVYAEQYGSVSKDYDYTAISDYVLSFGYNSKKMAILFTNNFRTNNSEQVKVLPQHLTTKWLEKHYNKQILNNKVKVLVGVIVPPQVEIFPNSSFKVLSLKQVNVIAFQSLSNDSKNSATSDTKKESPYTMPHRIFDRLVMMNFVNMNDKFTYTFEIYDVEQDVYTFIALPNSVKELLQNNATVSKSNKKT